MNIKQVIKLGEYSYDWVYIFTNPFTILSILLLLLGVIFLIKQIKKKGKRPLEEVMNGVPSMTIFAGLCLFFISQFALIIISSTNYYYEWQKEVAIPFVEQLPDKETSELVKFVKKRDTGLTSDPISYYITNSEKLENSVYGELTYVEDGKKKNVRGWFILEATDEAKASFVYKEVSEDLSDRFSKGRYNKMLKLPKEDYSDLFSTTFEFK